MGKNKKTMKKDVPTSPPPSEAFSSRGRLLVVAGGGAVLLGFFVLSYADPMGSNLAAGVSPFLILGGYASIGIGLFQPPDL